MISENSKTVIKYLQGLNGKDVTSADVADALGMTKRQIDGIFTSAIQKKELGVRVPGEMANPDGTHTPIKLLRLTDAGMAFDVDAVEE